MRNELLRGIADNFDDVASSLAYADWLQQEDAPRGELIALDIALETAVDREPLEERRRELIAKRGPALLGTTFSKFIAEGYGVVTWRRGFIDRLSYDGHHLPHKRAVGWLVRVICEEYPEPFTFLRELVLPKTDIATLTPLLRFAHLEKLDLDETNVADLSDLLFLPKLREVWIRDCPVTRKAIESLMEALPDLEILYSKPGR